MGCNQYPPLEYGLGIVLLLFFFSSFVEQNIFQQMEDVPGHACVQHAAYGCCCVWHIEEMIILTEHVDVSMFVVCCDRRVEVLATLNCMIFSIFA